MNALQPDTHLRVLLVEDNPGDALLLSESLADIGTAQFELVQVPRLHDALQQLEQEHSDIILLDLSLPDSQGVETFFSLHSYFTHIPIIVLTSLASEAFALNVIGGGGQDYLIKGQIDSQMLVRTICRAIARHQVQRELRTQALIDDLTGLHNRRGFFTRATQQIKLAQRRHSTCLVIFADVDGLKRINDTFGHDAGSQALIDAAQVLSATFRETDIISRFGGDEFVILALDTGPDHERAVTQRLQGAIAAHNQQQHRPYQLSISVGIVLFDPNGGVALEAAIARADQCMYQHKHYRQQERGV